MNLHQSSLLCGALAIMALNAGCDSKQETKTYSVEKSPAQATAPQSATPPATMPPGHPNVGNMPGAMPPGHPAMGAVNPAPGAEEKSAPTLNTGTPPPQWKMQPPTTMRLASFLVEGEKGATADISLIILGEAAGGILDNVNRWQAQLGQPDLTADDLAKRAQKLPSPLGEMTVVDLQGLTQGADPAKDGRIVAAMVSRDGMVFFFKMRGNAELVGAQKEDFLKWIGTVGLGEAKAETQAPTSATPAPSPVEAITAPATPAGSPTATP